MILFYFVIGFSKFFTHLLLFSLFHFYFSLSQLFFPSHSLLLLSSLFPLFFFPFIHFIFPFPALQTYILTTLLLVLKMCSHYFVIFFSLWLYSLIDALPIYFNQSCVPFFCCLPISSFYYFVACMFQAFFVPINVACDVGSNVNWLPN